MVADTGTYGTGGGISRYPGRISTILGDIEDTHYHHQSPLNHHHGPPMAGPRTLGDNGTTKDIMLCVPWWPSGCMSCQTH